MLHEHTFRRSLRTHHITHSQVWDCILSCGLHDPASADITGEAVNTACVWVNIAGTKVLLYIMNLLIAAHIQLVHIWILYVCFLSLCSYRPIDIFLICETIVDGSFFFGKFSVKNKSIYILSIPKMVRKLLSVLIQLVLMFSQLPNILPF